MMSPRRGAGVEPTAYASLDPATPIGRLEGRQHRFAEHHVLLDDPRPEHEGGADGRRHADDETERLAPPPRHHRGARDRLRAPSRVAGALGVASLQSRAKVGERGDPLRALLGTVRPLQRAVDAARAQPLVRLRDRSPLGEPVGVRLVWYEVGREADA